MRDVLRIFQERKEEIDLYFQHLNVFLIEDASIKLNDNSSYKLDVETKHILKANAFLLLYNVIECSIVQGIEAIYIDIIDKGLDYSQVKENIQKELIANIQKNYSTDRFVREVVDIAIDIMECYPNRLFSGNVNGEIIKDVALKYGFSYKVKGAIGKNIGKRLNTVKDKRNDLAHGSISFKECGQDYSIEELNLIKKEIIIFVKGILDNIDAFIRNQDYKR